MTPRKAPDTVLVALAEAACKRADLVRDWPRHDGTDAEIVRLATVYRAAVAPLRTRAEVDAEIVAHARDNYDTDVLDRDGYTVLARLLREPTADETEPVTAEPCGCEETDALHGKIARALLIAAKWHSFGDSAARSFADEITKALTDD